MSSNQIQRPDYLDWQKESLVLLPSELPAKEGLTYLTLDSHDKRGIVFLAVFNWSLIEVFSRKSLIPRAKMLRLAL